MLLLAHSENRNDSHNLVLGGLTAITAGIVNVCSVLAFFAFSSNVTGHLAVFAEELSKGHWHQVSVVLGWLLCFLFGAMVANLLVDGVGSRFRLLGHASAPLLQLALLMGVAFYCHLHYDESLRETEVLVSFLLFSMGLQNATVATVSNSVVKTTHVTGLFTDLGMELSMLVRGRAKHDARLRFKLALHLTILAGYLGGGVVGGLAFRQYRYLALFLAVAVLASVLAHDVALLWRRRRARSRALAFADPAE